MIGENQLISIALCTYNGEKYITEQLNSILEQSYQNLEIILVDDGSTDQTFSILQDFQRKDQRIRLYQNEKNLGFNANFNHALSLTTGDYIAIADQDDIWEKEKVAYMANAIKDDILLYHDSILIDEKGNSIGKKISDLHRFVKGDCSVFFLYHNCVSGHACLFHRSLLNYCNPFPPQMYYDWWMAYTAACLGKINFITPSFVKHRRHSESSTVNDKTNAKTQRIKTLNTLKAHPFCPSNTKECIVSLLKGYDDASGQKFSFKLFFLLLRNIRRIFYIRRKSPVSMVKFLFNEAANN